MIGKFPNIKFSKYELEMEKIEIRKDACEALQYCIDACQIEGWGWKYQCRYDLDGSQPWKRSCFTRMHIPQMFMFCPIFEQMKKEREQQKITE